MKKTNKIVKKTTNKKKTNVNKISAMIFIVAAILIVLGVGGYFLGNETLPSGGFNASTNTKTTKVRVASASFSVSNYEMIAGSSKTLPVNISPSNATNKKITCKSSNTKIATVTASGTNCIVKAKKKGTVKITATTKDKNKKATANIIISEVALTSIKFEKKSYDTSIDSIFNVNVKFNPTNASNQVITCASSDNSVVTASAQGASCVIKGLKLGKAIVTATSKDGEKKATTTINVTNTPVNLTIASWNIGRYSKYKTVASSLYGNKLKNAGVDIAGLQETKIMPNRTSSTSTTAQVKKIAKALIGGNITSKNYYIDNYQASGNAIVSKYALSNTRHIVLSKTNSKHMDKANIRVNGVNISFYNVHIGVSSEKDKPNQIATMAKTINDDPNPIILVGDFNSGTCNSTNDVILTALGSGYTRIARATKFLKKDGTYKDSCLDQIIINGKGKLSFVKGSNKEIITDKTSSEKFSDHNLIVATVKVTNQ